MTVTRGRASTFGAISIVNAIASGNGATASVKLATEVEVEMENVPGTWDVKINGKNAESKLALESIRLALKSAGREPKDFSGRIETNSNIPVGVGLKTSSSASTAAALAVLSALGQKAFDRQKVLSCSVEASLASGASITGALDDAAACLLGGVNLTDNLNRRIIKSKLFDKELVVVIKVPRMASKRSTTDPAFIRKFRDLTDLFFRMSLEGDYWRAMVLNGIAYSSILKYDPFPALRAVELGALGAGLSGTGPSIAAVFETSK
ncbi:MAG: shikimate kinase, partial [Thaumarchaeota archaeon]|nr:shikimate kinase [Nitrososphaerota archaeon]